MDKKTKIFTAVIQVALDFAFIGYCFSLYNGNKNSGSTYESLIIVFACFSNTFFTKNAKFGNKFLDTLIKFNGILFVIWVITIVVKLFI